MRLPRFIIIRMHVIKYNQSKFQRYEKYLSVLGEHLRVWRKYIKRSVGLVWEYKYFLFIVEKPINYLNPMIGVKYKGLKSLKIDPKVKKPMRHCKVDAI